MNDFGTSRVSGLEKRLGGLGLNLVRPVMCRDIEPLVWLLCTKAFSVSWSVRRVTSHTCREKEAQMELEAWLIRTILSSSGELGANTQASV